MIETRQKERMLDSVVKKLLRKGILPTVDIATRGVVSKMLGKVWGNPTTVLRPAMRGTKVGGVDGKDIERTYLELQDDTELLYEELIAVSESALSSYQIFNAQTKLLRRRILRLLQQTSGLLNFFSRGSRYVFQDTFNNTNQVDLLSTTAELDMEEGVAILPRAKSSLSPYDCSTAVVVSQELPPGAKVLSELSNAFKESENTLWQAVLGGGTYTATVAMAEDGTPAGVLYTVNGFYIEPATTIAVAVEWTNDGYNYYPLFSDNISTAKTWSFEPVSLLQFRISISGNEVGIKRMRPLVLGFGNTGSVMTDILRAVDIYGSNAELRTARLITDTYTPKGTDIKAYITAVSDNSADNWVPIERDPVSLVAISARTTELCTDTDDSLVSDNPSGSIQFYTYSLGDTAILDGTEYLTKGNRQFYVDYFNYDWGVERDDPLHVPSYSDWNGRTGIKSCYLSPITVQENADAMSDGDAMSSAKNPMCEAPLRNIDGYVTNKRGWLVLALLDGAGVQLLERGGNYKFTTYIKCPKPILFKDQKTLVYNPATFGGSGDAALLPFHIYLNGESVIYSDKSFSDINSAGINDYTATYSMKMGWNKLEICVYCPTMEASAQGGQLADQSVGLYFSPNVIGLDSDSYLVQATQGYQQRVSEFTLKHLTPLGYSESWAWGDRAHPDDTWKLYLNYRPKDLMKISALDGITMPSIPRLTLNFDKSSSGSSVNSVKLRFDLSKAPDANATPKLSSYTLFLD